PISSAANPSAAVRLATPPGPWKRYACAGSSAIATRSSRFASACSGKLSNASMDLLCDLLGRVATVDGHDAVGEHRRKLAVRAIDTAVEVPALAFDPVSRARPRGGGCGVDEDEKRPVGEEPTHRVVVQLQNAVDPEPTGDSLVRERRVDVAVADHVFSRLEGGLDHLLDELGARRRKQRRLSPRGHVPPVQE